jgi:hypothetical protein
MTLNACSLMDLIFKYFAKHFGALPRHVAILGEREADRPRVRHFWHRSIENLALLSSPPGSLLIATYRLSASHFRTSSGVRLVPACG